MKKTCTKCGSEGPFWNMTATKDGLDYWCTSCRKALNIQWRKDNPERNRELGRNNQYDRYSRLKREFVDAYGGACTCCGEMEIHFLTIEHLDGLPDYHKRQDGKRKPGLTLFSLIKEEGYPDDYTVLCMNCNYSKGHYGFCPHQPHEESDRRY